MEIQSKCTVVAGVYGYYVRLVRSSKGFSHSKVIASAATGEVDGTYESAQNFANNWQLQK